MPKLKKVCILSNEEIGRLEVYKEDPSCADHEHMYRNKALAEVADGNLEIYVAPDGRQFLKHPVLYFLAKRMSARVIPVIQRVKMNPPKHVSFPI